MHSGVMVNAHPTEIFDILSPYGENDDGVTHHEQIVTAQDIQRLASIFQDFPDILPLRQMLDHNFIKKNNLSHDFRKRFAFDWYYTELIKAHIQYPENIPSASLLSAPAIAEELARRYEGPFIYTADGDVCIVIHETLDVKWDWYVMGGRWSDLLHIKPQFAHQKGVEWGVDVDDVTLDNEEALPLRCDWAKVHMIDIDSMQQEYNEEVSKAFDVYMELAEPYIKCLDTNDMQSLEDMRSEHIEQLKATPSAVSVMMAHKIAQMDITLYPSHQLDLFAIRAGLSKGNSIIRSVEEYLENHPWHFGFYAVVLADGEWVEDERFQISDFDQDSYITIIDCHN